MPCLAWSGSGFGFWVCVCLSGAALPLRALCVGSLVAMPGASGCARVFADGDVVVGDGDGDVDGESWRCVRVGRCGVTSSETFMAQYKSHARLRPQLWPRRDSSVAVAAVAQSAIHFKRCA